MALHALALAARAEQWAQVENKVMSIQNADTRAMALRTLAQELARAGQQNQLPALIQ